MLNDYFKKTKGKMGFSDMIRLNKFKSRPLQKSTTNKNSRTLLHTLRDE